MSSRLLAALFLSAALIFPARATTFSTDVSDLWWNPNESGWGVNIIHQHDTLFLTFFLYGPSGAPVWYVAPSVVFAGTQGTSFIYSGQLLQTNGPWFGGFFNPASVTNRAVGTVSLNFNSISNGTITYSVDGVNVSKPITRQTWKINNLIGNYIGAGIGTYSGCPFANGYSEEAGLVTVSQTATSITMVLVQAGVSCTYAGPYVQAGRMGAASGSAICSNGLTGTFSAFEIEGSISGLTARAIVTYGSCRWEGRFGGLRRGG